ncbi:MAG TPA: TolC family protein [Candidatus Xenobia bacterium]|jgi:outer membrane protein TolC
MRKWLALWMLLAGAGQAAPLSLDDAVRIALAQRPELRAAADELAMKQAEWRSRQAELRPAASVSVFGVTQNTGMIETTTPHVMPTFYANLPPGTVLDADVMAMWPLYTGGRLEHQVAGALVAAHIAEDEAEAEVESVVREVRKGYLAVLEAQAELQVRTAAVTEETESARVARLRFQTGKAAAVEASRAETELADAQQAKNDATAQVDQAMADLELALATPQGSELSLDGKLPAVAEVPELASLQAAAQRQRPDLRAARLQGAVAEAELGTAEGAYRPEVALVGMGQSTSVAGQGLQGGTSLAVTASVPLFDGGQRHQQVLAAKAHRDKQWALAAAAAQGVERDVQRAWVAVKAQQANLDVSEGGLRAAEETDRIAHLRENLGAGIQLEVLDAEAALVRARLNRLKALYGYHAALADLDWSVGQARQAAP